MHFPAILIDKEITVSAFTACSENVNMLVCIIWAQVHF